MWFTEKGYEYLAKGDASATVIVLGLPERGFLDRATTFSYLFALFGILLVIARKLGVPLDPDDMLALVTVIAGYLVGQGLADAGKSAEQVRQSTTTTTTATATAGSAAAPTKIITTTTPSATETTP